VIVQGVTSPTLHWPEDKVSGQTLGQLRLGDLNLVDYNYCHIRRTSLSESTIVLSCTPSLDVALDKVVWESSGRSSGGHVGHQLGRLGPLLGRRVF
jgi:hypothetical protein